MARIGVTYSDIAKAAETIKSQGQEPTVDRVRECLGTGSKSTIAPHLKQWRNNNSDLKNNSGLPNELLEVVKSLYDRIQQTADFKISQMTKSFKSEQETLSNELNDSKSHIAQLLSQQNNLEQGLKNAEDDNRSLSNSADCLQKSLDKTEFEHIQAQSRIEEFKSMVSELKQENKDIRAHFEHYQQHIAEDRQQEREQFHLANEQLQNQIKDLSGRYTESEKQISKQRQVDSEKHKIIEQLQTQNQILVSEKNQNQSEINLLNNQLISYNKKHQKLNEQKKCIQGELKTLVSEQTETQHEMNLLQYTLEQTKSELFNSQNKIAIQDNDYKILLQEKSVIKGQFKQLQSSL